SKSTAAKKVITRQAPTEMERCKVHWRRRRACVEAESSDRSASGATNSSPGIPEEKEKNAGPGALIEHAGWAWGVSVALIAALVIGLSLLYGPPKADLALLLIVGLSALLSGWLRGFLFAIPRSRTVAETTEGQTAGRTVTIRPNTNLEEVSDWLTKIIVAVTLVQLGQIPEAGKRLFVAVGNALGGGRGDTVFAGAVIVTCAVAGFVLGWMVTRIFIGGWMNAADTNPAFEPLADEAFAATSDRGASTHLGGPEHRGVVGER
ncbi:MAG TPA: hypothetical protein VER55_12715, partial [Ardenticatenaceae bacterium]|nr:hypothetical protein [Ardenticatenaceae bacterium]